MTRRRCAAVAVVVLLATGCGSTVQVRGSFQSTEGVQGPNGSVPGSTDLPLGGSAPGAVGTGGSVGQPGGSSSAPQPGQSTGSGPTAGTASARPSAVPAKGFGWDARNVYIGIPTADDFNGVVKNLGANFSNGDVHGDVDAVVADINRTGGILGRKLVAVYHDAATTDYSSNPSVTAQAMCTYFTQDRPVVAVISGVPQLDGQESFHRCLEAKQVTLISGSNTDFSDGDYRKLGPHLWTSGSLSTDILVPSMVGGLKRAGYFSGWNVLNGGSSKDPVRVGLLLPDTPQGHHVATVFAAQLKKAGITLASTFFYAAAGLGNKSQSEVLQFETAKVTHVLDLPPVAAEMYFFETAAEQQQYRPRYGFTSFNLPLGTEENPTLAPQRQQVGSMGIGWQPYNDVNAAHDPGGVPGQRRCLSAMSKGGQSFGSGARRAAFIAVQLCDAFYVLREAMVASHGFTGADLLRGMPLLGTRFLTAGTFSSALSQTNQAVPGYYRDMLYRTDCSCFAYSGGNHLFSR
ncbi:MAG: hypothetical protein JWM40_2528 [Frankiales bacterium]|nr:hypothetical protein [Frankiales bacterium]